MNSLDASLFTAALKDNENNVIAFLKRGANPKALSNTTLLNILAERGATQMIGVLLDADLDANIATTETGVTPLMSAARAGHHSTIELLIIEV